MKVIHIPEEKEYIRLLEPVMEGVRSFDHEFLAWELHPLFSRMLDKRNNSRMEWEVYLVHERLLTDLALILEASYSLIYAYEKALRVYNLLTGKYVEARKFNPNYPAITMPYP